jgi:hypothetical protein
MASTSPLFLMHRSIAPEKLNGTRMKLHVKLDLLVLLALLCVEGSKRLQHGFHSSSAAVVFLTMSVSVQIMHCPYAGLGMETCRLIASLSLSLELLESREIFTRRTMRIIGCATRTAYFCGSVTSDK